MASAAVPSKPRVLKDLQNLELEELKRVACIADGNIFRMSFQAETEDSWRSAGPWHVPTGCGPEEIFCGRERQESSAQSAYAYKTALLSAEASKEVFNLLIGRAFKVEGRCDGSCILDRLPDQKADSA